MAFLLRGLLILGLVGLNAFFAAAEYALLSVRRTRLELLARQGDHRARQAQSLLSDVGLLISGTQLGVTVLSLLLGWLGEGIVAAALEHLFEGRLTRFASVVVAHSIAVSLALLLIIVFLMVLGELVPKALAYARAEQVSLLVARPMQLFLSLSRYPVRGLERLGNLVLRALGQASGHGLHVARHTPEEVKLIVSGIRKRGLLGEEQEEMIHGVFDLHRVLVREIMVPRPQITCLPLTQDLNLLLERVVEDQHSRLPIYEGLPEHVVGILYTKDLLRAVLERRRRGIALEAPFDLRSILHEPMIVPETMPLSRMLEEARRRHSQMALVVDEFGTFMGLVTIEDVLEQIVGEIQDEYDREERAIQKAGDDVLVIDGAMNLLDLADDYGVALPRGVGYETLAGFILARLGTIPQGGETFVFEGRRYTVLGMEGRRIAQVKVEKLTGAGAPAGATAIRPKPSSA
jgi:magnesium and cobalt exporter, CNNM family